jgi:uncharacterized protein YdbL (DUF1318 family)
MNVAMRNLSWWVLPGFWLLTACVTVNIYFPAAAAEKAADKIIEDVWGRKLDGEPPAESRLNTPHALIVGVLDVLVPPAAAANFDINTPAINTIKQSMAARFGRLQGYFGSGAVGLTRDGLIAIRDINGVPLDQRNAVQQLVAQENQDRNALYREIARANGHPEWEPEIRATFAGRWINQARPGWWYQGPAGWRRK